MKKILLLAVVAAVIVAGGAFFALKGGKTNAAADTAPVEQTTASAETTTSSDVDYSSASLPTDPLGVRTLGNPDAPVKIEEFASLTCGHCANFHGTTFKELKTKYIDTGKVFFTFTDFPLNAPALDASMVARCMAPERYFTFLSFLMETQEQWAFSADYKTSLRQNAKLAGMTDESYDACLANTALKDGLVDRMKAKAEEHKLNSTPSFVITGPAGKSTLTGALPIVSFDAAIAEAEKAAAPAETTAPATTEEAAPATTEEAAPAVEEAAPVTEEAPAAVTEEAPAVEETPAPEPTTAPEAETPAPEAAQ